MLYWLLAIPVLGILILSHELGHFFAARWMKVRVLEFGIGFPPRMLTLGERSGVRYTLNWIPIGGFVRMAGEEDPTVEGGLAEKKPWQRAIVLSAGAAMHLLLAFLLFTGLALAPHEVVTLQDIGVVGIIPDSPADDAGLRGGDILLEVNGVPFQDERGLQEITLNRGLETPLLVERQGTILTLTVIPSREPLHGADYLGVSVYLHEAPEAVLGQVIPGRPAYEAGLRPGDVVVALDGHIVRNNLDFWDTYFHRRAEGSRLVFLVRRDGQDLEFSVTPPSPEEENQSLGIGWSPPTERVQLSIFEALGQGAQDTIDAMLLVPRTLWALARGAVQVQELSGPIGMAQATAEVAQTNQVEQILRLVGILAANLCVVNLLPLPAFDGGRLVFVLLEWLRRGRRIPHHWEGWVHLVGFFLLLALLAIVSYFDIVRLISP